VAALRGPSTTRDEATAELHALLLRGARFKLIHARDHLSSEARESLAIEAADAALGDVLARLDHFRETSRFTTWASKFAVREARVRLSRLPAGTTPRGVPGKD
jgi:hypothetical protein